ncbi:MAG: stalk domain-containing protein [Armatimonadota bacterium]|nr:stalk domain-containing protein [Armatimonadota bacterium]
MLKLPRVIIAVQALTALTVLVCYLPASALEATLLAPPSGAKVRGAKTEVAIGYNAGSTESVTRIELLIDDVSYASKVFDAPRTRGVASFMWDSRQAPNGKHKLQAKIYSQEKLLTTVAGSVVSANEPGAVRVAVAKFENVTSGAVLSGDKEVRLSVTGVGSSPMVAVLVDKSVKAIKNQPPYNFVLDTKSLPEGRHILEAYALDDAGNRIDAQPLEISVRNLEAEPAAAVTAKTAPKSEVKAAEKPPAPKNSLSSQERGGVKTSASARTAQTPKPAAAQAQTKPPAPLPKPAVAAKPVPPVAKPTSVPAVKTAKPPPAKSPAAFAAEPVAKSADKQPAHVASLPPKSAQPKPVASASAKGAAKPASKPAAKPPAVAPARISAAPVKAAATSAPIASATRNIQPKNTLSRPVETAEEPKPGHTTLPPVKVAWAAPASKKASPLTRGTAVINMPEPEPRDSAPPDKVKPAASAVAPAHANPPSAPSVTRPSAPPPAAKPVKPVVAEAAPKPTPNKPVAVAVSPKPALPGSAPAKPAVAAVAPKPAPTSSAPVKPAVVAAAAPNPTVKPQAEAGRPEPIRASEMVSLKALQHAPKKMIEVSLRWALEQAGLTVSFAGDGQIIRGANANKQIEFQVGAKEVLVDDHVVVLPSPISTVRGRAMIPLSFIVEQLGLALKNPQLLTPR